MYTVDPNDILGQADRFGPYEHAAISATTTIQLWRTSSPFRVEAVSYVNPAGFAADPSNYWTIDLLQGATVVASWSTQTAAQGALTADTFVSLVLSSTDVNRVLARAGTLTTISLRFTKTGAPANLPLGRISGHGRTV